MPATQTITKAGLDRFLESEGFKTMALNEGFTSTHNQRGVRLLWKVVGDSIYMSTSCRKVAGGRFDFEMTADTGFELLDLEQIRELRGAPGVRTSITKNKLPEPFQFKSVPIMQKGKFFERMDVIRSAQLLGPVGITDRAKVDSETVYVPEEAVWWYFDCIGEAGATFNIITDTEVWYPVNRRSGRITTKLTPKKSVDLTKMSKTDQELLIYIIQDFIQKM